MSIHTAALILMVIFYIMGLLNGVMLARKRAPRKRDTRVVARRNVPKEQNFGKLFFKK